jgi:hypothetical protein
VEAFKETVVSRAFLNDAIEVAALSVAMDVLRADRRGPGMDEARRDILDRIQAGALRLLNGPAAKRLADYCA